jgi:hypothetical protein
MLTGEVHIKQGELLTKIIPPTSSKRQGKESFCPKTMRTKSGEVRRSVSIGVVNL